MMFSGKEVLRGCPEGEEVSMSLLIRRGPERVVSVGGSCAWAGVMPEEGWVRSSPQPSWILE